MTILHCQYFIKSLIKCILGREKSDSDYMFVAKFGEYWRPAENALNINTW